MIVTKHDLLSRGVGKFTVGNDLAYRALRASVGMSRRLSLGLIASGLLACWVLSRASGGADAFAPHWYYLPILFAATRFGPLAAFIVACVAGLLAGPLTPADTAVGRSQELIQWLSRAGFFVLIGQVSAWLLAPTVRYPLAEKSSSLQLYQLRKLGVKLAIDDFGTGYSSLSYLNRFQVDILKIDRSLVAHLDTDESSQRLARAIVGLAETMQLKTVAEGIETAEQLEIGRQLHFDLVQGYHFERPQSGEKIPDLMLASSSPAGMVADEHGHMPG